MKLVTPSAAPIVEEILFRGLLFAGLRHTLGLRPGVWISALLFASVHAEIGFGVIFALGAILAWLYDRTRSLVAPMIAHAVHNGLGVTLLS